MSISINAVNLKDLLRDIETNCCDRLHARLLRSWRKPQQRPLPGRSHVGGGAVHSIVNGIENCREAPTLAQAGGCPNGAAL